MLNRAFYLRTLRRGWFPSSPPVTISSNSSTDTVHSVFSARPSARFVTARSTHPISGHNHAPRPEDDDARRTDPPATATTRTRSPAGCRCRQPMQVLVGATVRCLPSGPRRPHRRWHPRQREPLQRGRQRRWTRHPSPKQTWPRHLRQEPTPARRSRSRFIRLLPSPLLSLGAATRT